MFNQSSMTEFLLLGFSDIREIQLLTSGLFLLIYLVTITGNLLVVIVIATSHLFHTPMYFFLMNLSILDLGSVSITIPKATVNALLNTRIISYYGCTAQVFLLFFFFSSEIFLLTIMAYDRYIAICHPLHYETVMNSTFCFQMATSAWIGGLFYGILHTSCTFIITFCSNVINQFFCEVPQLLKLSCSNLYLIEVGALVIATSIDLCCFTFIVASYVHIFRTVMAMPSVEGKQKTFATCIPHLTVVSLFFTVGIFAYLKPTSSSPSDWDLAISFMYAVAPPMMNPIVYTIRNKDIKAELYKAFHCRVYLKRKMTVFHLNT